MVYLAFLRHGPTEWNQKRLYQGRTHDIEILAESRLTLQKYCLPDRFLNYDLYCSPLKRAQQTLRALTDKNYKTVDSLVECDFGEWEGKSYKQVCEQYPHRENGYDGLDYKYHSGESYREAQNRLLSWAQTLQQDSLAVSHKAAITALYAKAVDWDVLSPPPHQLDFQKLQLYSIENSKIKLIEHNIDLEDK